MYFSEICMMLCERLNIVIIALSEYLSKLTINNKQFHTETSIFINFVEKKSFLLKCEASFKIFAKEQQIKSSHPKVFLMKVF